MKTSSILTTSVVIAAICGCSSIKRTDTARTAREQLLISNAVDQSLDKVDFSAFRGRSVVIEEKYLECIDKGYIISSIRHRIALAGATIVPKVDDADILLELRSGGVGTDNADAFLGIPHMSMPGMMSIPEIKLISRTNQSAVAKIGLVAYDARTMQPLGDGGISLAQSADNNWFFLGIGPHQDGHVRKEVEHAGMRNPGQPYTQIPAQVAFNAPPPGQPPRVRLANDAVPAGRPPTGPTQAVGESTPIEQ